MNVKKYDFVSKFLSQIAYKLHPKLGGVYEKHVKFFNDGIVELLCLVIANTFIAVASYYFIGLPLALLSFCFVTPITFCIKYFLHKFWVWTSNDS